MPPRFSFGCASSKTSPWVRSRPAATHPRDAGSGRKLARCGSAGHSKQPGGAQSLQGRIQLAGYFFGRLVDRGHAQAPQKIDDGAHGEVCQFGRLREGELPLLEERQREAAMHTLLEKALVEWNGKDRRSPAVGDQRESTELCTRQEVLRARAQITN